MNSNGEFTVSDLLYYEKAKKDVLIYLSNKLSMFCNQLSIKWMISDRIKSLKSINDKIAKKKEEKGKDFSYETDLLDIAGLRIIFCDESDLHSDVRKLDSEICNMTPDDFVDKFQCAQAKPNSCNLEYMYRFVGFLMEQSQKVDEIINVDIVKDYVKYPKASGYQSIHVIINVMVESIDENGDLITKKCPVEIQIRNFLQHLFDEREHDVRYKKSLIDSSYDYSGAFDMAKKVLNIYSASYHNSCFDIDRYNGKQIK